MDLIRRKAELDEKVQALEAEKASLLADIETLKAISVQEEKVAALEADIAQLAQEKKTLEAAREPAVAPPPACEETQPSETTAEKQATESAPAETPAEAPAGENSREESQPCEPCQENADKPCM